MVADMLVRIAALFALLEAAETMPPGEMPMNKKEALARIKGHAGPPEARRSLPLRAAKDPEHPKSHATRRVRSIARSGPPLALCFKTLHAAGRDVPFDGGGAALHGGQEGGGHLRPALGRRD